VLDDVLVAFGNIASLADAARGEDGRGGTMMHRIVG
jgi:hypothetical protein